MVFVIPARGGDPGAVGSLVLDPRLRGDDDPTSFPTARQRGMIGNPFSIQSALMFASRTSLPHLSISLRMNAANCAGVRFWPRNASTWLA